MSIEVATFRVNNTLWGINILQVRENIRNIHPTEIPLTPGQIAGLINLRGQIVTIVDMWIHLNYDQAARPKLKENFCIILKTSAELEKVILNQIASSPLVEMGADPVGLLVDVLGDVVTIEESDVDEPLKVLHGGGLSHQRCCPDGWGTAPAARSCKDQRDRHPLTLLFSRRSTDPGVSKRHRNLGANLH